MTSPNMQRILVGVGSAIWLISATVLGRFVWHEVPWILVLLFAGMLELIVLTLGLVGSTLHDPVKRWDLPPNPADAHRGWRGALGSLRASASWAVQFLRQKLSRKPAKT